MGSISRCVNSLSVCWRRLVRRCEAAGTMVHIESYAYRLDSDPQIVDNKQRAFEVIYSHKRFFWNNSPPHMLVLTDIWTLSAKLNGSCEYEKVFSL